MFQLLDSNLWIDFSRAKSPARLKRFISPFINSPDVVLVEPVAFEVNRHSRFEKPKVQELFDNTPLLTTPMDLWIVAAELGIRCRRAGIAASSLDLLIATAAIHHQCTLVTFDQDFSKIASISTLQVNLLQKPTSL